MFGFFDNLFEPEYNPYEYYQPRQAYRRAPAYQDLYTTGRQRPQTTGWGYGYPDEEYVPYTPQRQVQRQQPRAPKAARQVVREEPAPEPQKAKVTWTQPEQAKVAPSEDSQEAPKITNRESRDPPEVAFKTYRPRNLVTYIPQILSPKSAEAQSFLRMDPGAAVISIPIKATSGVPELQATGDGVLSIRFQAANGQAALLEYKLPDFYERSEISARREEEAYVVRIPLRGDAKDDVVVI